MLEPIPYLRPSWKARTGYMCFSHQTPAALTLEVCRDLRWVAVTCWPGDHPHPSPNSDMNSKAKRKREKEKHPSQRCQMLNNVWEHQTLIFHNHPQHYYDLSFVSSTTRKCTSAEVVEFQAFYVLHLKSGPTYTTPTETGWQKVHIWYSLWLSDLLKWDAKENPDTLLSWLFIALKHVPQGTSIPGRWYSQHPSWISNSL